MSTGELGVVSAPRGSGRAPLFVDTNVLLRFLTNDVPEQAAAAEALFQRAAIGELGLITNSMVLAELVWVLESYYHLLRPEVRERVLAVVHMEGLTLPDADLVSDAMFTYEVCKVDFVDAYNACWMRQRKLERIVTFDANHFTRLDWVSIESGL
jgi:predicted nucleic-acid-binding protein